MQGERPAIHQEKRERVDVEVLVPSTYLLVDRALRRSMRNARQHLTHRAAERAIHLSTCPSLPAERFAPSGTHRRPRHEFRWLRNQREDKKNPSDNKRNRSAEHRSAVADKKNDRSKEKNRAANKIGVP
jgi:hypothetical protein